MRAALLACACAVAVFWGGSGLRADGQAIRPPKSLVVIPSTSHTTAVIAAAGRLPSAEMRGVRLSVVDSSNPDDPMAQLAVVLLALFAQMERTYMLERAAHARAVATAKGRRVGRPTVVNPNQLDYARRLRDEGATIADIVAKTGIARSSLYRHMPPRTPDSLTVEPADQGMSA